MKIELLPHECWWGGNVLDAAKMPFDANSNYTVDLYVNRKTQTAPLFLSNAGRYIWSEEPFKITFCDGWITIESKHKVELAESGNTLRSAYLAAMQAHFPFEPNIHTQRIFYQYPQFNTWMELIKNQNQADIIQYAEEIVANGYTPGILMIDGGWQKCQGNWEVNRELMPDPKGMVARLHALGFIVMIWVSPFMCAEGQVFLDLCTARSSEFRHGKDNYNHLLRDKSGMPAIHHWWSGYGAIYNFLLPDDCAHMAAQLRHLMDDYGFDGFKFDGGSYRGETFITGTDFYGGYTPEQLNIAWIDFAAQYQYHEVKDSWKQGGKPVIQRLADKEHHWQGNGLDCLIPHGCFCGLIGMPFVCPDMVGGGEWSAFVYGRHDEELFVRMAQCTALFPMMQFSSLPWRHLSAEGQAICREMARLHEDCFPMIEQVLSDTERSGEPIIRSMEYQYPHSGFEKCNDQFMLGTEVLVAPVVTKGAREREVQLPCGRWVEQNTKVVYTGPATVRVAAPLTVLPWFVRETAPKK